MTAVHRCASLIFHGHVLLLRSPHTPRTTRTFHPTGSTTRFFTLRFTKASLRDITAVARLNTNPLLREEEEQGEEIVHQALLDPYSSVSISPRSVGVKLRTPVGSRVPRIFLDFSDLAEVESESSYLNSVVAVEKVVRESSPR
ncbi:hypothetical protein RJT34_22613 [Clitoria ternatea]|uniref:Uncharacterized protein n=1 Tax=Clitoria ternatea TaxID=43366 RepID=A0AAN9IE69_CLITE